LPFRPAAPLVEQREKELSLALWPGGDGALAAPEAPLARPIEEPSLYPIGYQPGRNWRPGGCRIGREVIRAVLPLRVERHVLHFTSSWRPL
jgi:hypothetical protein